MEKLEACIKDKAVPEANNAALIIKHLLDAAALCLYVILQQSLRCVEELRKKNKDKTGQAGKTWKILIHRDT